MEFVLALHLIGKNKFYETSKPINSTIIQNAGI